MMASFLSFCSDSGEVEGDKGGGGGGGIHHYSLIWDGGYFDTFPTLKIFFTVIQCR